MNSLYEVRQRSDKTTTNNLYVYWQVMPSPCNYANVNVHYICIIPQLVDP